MERLDAFLHSEEARDVPEALRVTLLRIGKECYEKGIKEVRTKFERVLAEDKQELLSISKRLEDSLLERIALDGRLVGLKAQLGRQEEAENRVRKELEASSSAMEKLKLDMLATANRNAYLAERLDLKNAEVSKLNGLLDEALQSHREAAEKDGILRKQLRDAETEIGRLRDSNRRYEELVSSMDADNKRLRRMMVEMSNNFGDLNAKTKKCVADIQQLSGVREHGSSAASSARDRLTETLDSAEADIATLSKKHNKTWEEHQKAMEKAIRRQKFLEEMAEKQKEMLEEKQKEIEKLEENCESLSASNKDLTEKMQRHRSIESLPPKSAQSVHEVSSTSQNVFAEEQEVSSTLCKEYRILMEECSNLRKENEELQNLKAEVGQLTKQMKETKRKYFNATIRELDNWDLGHSNASRCTLQVNFTNYRDINQLGSFIQEESLGDMVSSWDVEELRNQNRKLLLVLQQTINNTELVTEAVVGSYCSVLRRQVTRLQQELNTTRFYRYRVEHDLASLKAMHESLNGQYRKRLEAALKQIAIASEMSASQAWMAKVKDIEKERSEWEVSKERNEKALEAERLKVKKLSATVSSLNAALMRANSVKRQCLTRVEKLEQLLKPFFSNDKRPTDLQTENIRLKRKVAQCQAELRTVSARLKQRSKLEGQLKTIIQLVKQRLMMTGKGSLLMQNDRPLLLAALSSVSLRSEDRIKNMGRMVGKLSNTVRRKRRQVTDLMGQVQKLEKCNAELEEKLKAQQEDLRLTESLMDADLDVGEGQLRLRLSMIGRLYTSTTRQVSELSTRLAVAEQELKDYKTLCRSLEEGQAQSVEAMATLKRSNEATVNALNAEAEELRNKINQLSELLNTTKQEYERKVSDYEGQLETLRTEASKMTLDSAILREKFNGQMERIGTLNALLESTKQELIERTAQVSTLEQELTDSKCQMDRIRDCLMEREGEMASLESCLAEDGSWMEKEATLTNQLAEREQRLASVQAENERLFQQIAAISDKLLATPDLTDLLSDRVLAVCEGKKTRFHELLLRIGRAMCECRRLSSERLMIAEIQMMMYKTRCEMLARENRRLTELCCPDDRTGSDDSEVLKGLWEEAERRATAMTALQNWSEQLLEKVRQKLKIQWDSCPADIHLLSEDLPSTADIKGSDEREIEAQKSADTEGSFQVQSDSTGTRAPSRPSVTIKPIALLNTSVSVLPNAAASAHYTHVEQSYSSTSNVSVGAVTSTVTSQNREAVDTQSVDDINSPGDASADSSDVSDVEAQTTSSHSSVVTGKRTSHPEEDVDAVKRAKVSPVSTTNEPTDSLVAESSVPQEHSSVITSTEVPSERPESTTEVEIDEETSMEMGHLEDEDEDEASNQESA